MIFTRQYTLTIRVNNEESTEMLESSHGISVWRNLWEWWGRNPRPGGSINIFRCFCAPYRPMVLPEPKQGPHSRNFSTSGYNSMELMNIYGNMAFLKQQPDRLMWCPFKQLDLFSAKTIFWDLGTWALTRLHAVSWMDQWQVARVLGFLSLACHWALCRSPHRLECVLEARAQTEHNRTDMSPQPPNSYSPLLSFQMLWH